MNLFCLVICYSYQIVHPGLVSFVVQMSVFLLQVELDPVVKPDDFCSRFCLSNKDVLKPTGVQADGDWFRNRNKNSLPKRCAVIHWWIQQLYSVVWGLAGVLDTSPRVSLPVVEVEPDQVELILELPQIRTGLSFSHQVLMSPLWTENSDNIHQPTPHIPFKYVIKADWK